MASTNKTTNYDLSQYIGTDKPTYLTDYNQDMSKIDTGIHAAKSEADQNATDIGTLANLDTTVKTDLVSAINEVEGEAVANASNISTNTSNIATNTTHIGTLTNLTTATKTDLVNAVNEVKSNVGTVGDLDTTDKTSTVAAINEVNTNLNALPDFNLVNIKDYSSGTDISISSGGSLSSTDVKVASNADGSVFKFYGQINASFGSSAKTITLTNTGINPDESFSIISAGYRFDNNTMYRNNITIKANGDIEMTITSSSGRLFFTPCIYFAKSFGDVPSE